MATAKKNKIEAQGGDFWDRLKVASEWAGLPCTPSSIAKELRIGPSAVTKYVQGGFPGKAKINRLAITRRVSSEWLFSGQGSMVLEGVLDTETQELLRLWRALDETAKGRLMVNLRYEYTVGQATMTGPRHKLTDALIQQLRNPKPQ